jgi:hypothetical protein
MTELEEIQQKYDSGQLDHIKRDLERFIVAHRAKIDEFRKELAAKFHRELSEDFTIKQYILKHRSINPESEIREQLEEIQKEKWIRGIQQGCAPDDNEVFFAWSKAHGAGWRAHRVTTIIYVFDRDKQRYVDIFQKSGAS